MNAAINQTVAPDQYIPGGQPGASTIESGRFMDHANLDVVNGGIYWSVRITDQPGGSPGLGQYGGEVYMGPGSRTISRANMSGVRFRAAIPLANLPAGQFQALVTLEAIW